MKVYILKGKWQQETVTNMEFDMVSKDIMVGKLGLYVTVDGAPLSAITKNVRIYLADRSHAVIKGQVTSVGQSAPAGLDIPVAGDYDNESEEDTIARIDERFSILSEMAGAAVSGGIRGLVVTGAPGTGKSFGVEAKLKKNCNNYEIVRGNVSPLGLYKKLYEYSDKKSVLVFDDSDSVFFDLVSLGLLKAACDTSEVRNVSWNLESNILKDEDIPRSFEFKGVVIFITNMDLETGGSKQLQPHWDALISRSHYLDLTIRTQRDKFLRIKSLVNGSDMLRKYGFSAEQKEDILDYMQERMHELRELSLRTTLKIADLMKIMPNGWRRRCDVTVCRR